jgi:hypothetical protein
LESAGERRLIEISTGSREWVVGEVVLKPLNNVNHKSQGAGDIGPLIYERNF